MVLAADGQARPGAFCKGDYSYAGVQSAATRSGIRANLKVLRPASVHAGHVGGWVGVGGPGKGPGGTDQWLQAGYSAFPDGAAQLYYEVALPRAAPQYHVVKAAVKIGESHLVSILGVGSRPGAWRVWVDNSPASPVYFLRGSHGRYEPQGIGETWSPNASACNTFAWRFGSVRVAMRPGGVWVKGKAAHEWNDRGYLVRFVPPDSFDTFSSDLGALTGNREAKAVADRAGARK